LRVRVLSIEQDIQRKYDWYLIQILGIK